MSRSLQFALFVPRSGGSCVLKQNQNYSAIMTSLQVAAPSGRFDLSAVFSRYRYSGFAVVAALFLGAGSFSLLRGQTPAAPADPDTATALPATPAPAANSAPVATDSSSSANAAAPAPDPNAVAAAFGQDQGPSLPPSSRSAGSRQWNRSMIDPFEPGPNFGNFSGSSGGGIGFSGAGFNSTGGFGGARPGGMGMGGRQGTAGPVFPDSGLASGSNGSFGAAPLGVPSLNQMMRGSLNVPLSSSTSSLRFTYQDAIRLGGNPGEMARPSASMMFSTSDLGNGVFFSAGTSYGRSMGGTPAASLGSNSSAEGKHSGPSVALKLSF